ncbi:MAG TPA: arylamine N-acetyltransferase [Thermoanaerobaculia bacterium]|nr:arylamine N-acetyltransferase [Thermoanaerobaculia bacterium]
MIDEYLARIGYDGPRQPTPEVLRALHVQHLLTVPFENLDIHLGREILTDEQRIVDKVVRRRRGGFCYELNGAFAALLRALGFDVEMLSARVPRADGTTSPEFDHMTLLVRAGGERWLADVGFGECFLHPKRIDFAGDQPDPCGTFRIEQRNARDWLLSSAQHSEYLFSLEPHPLADYAEMCFYHQTSPQSSFTQKRVCTLATPTGRITLRDDRLIVTENGTKREEPIANEDAWRAALRENFGVELGNERTRTF